MEHVDGVVVAERLPETLATPSARRRLSEELVDALVELHDVDPRLTGVRRLRQADGLRGAPGAAVRLASGPTSTRDVPDVDAVTAWLRVNLPAAGAHTVVHGDYRLGNVMVAADAPVLRAVLDWEMATLGDPLADLGYLCATWARPARRGERDHPPVARDARAGFASPDDLRHRYALRSGRDVDDLSFYQVLALWKATIFLEASYRRYRTGRPTIRTSPRWKKESLSSLAMRETRRRLSDRCLAERAVAG